MAVHIAHINKTFGKQQVLRDVTLDIPDGQIVGLLGPNGAGKSTLMKILIGLWEADNGLQVTGDGLQKPIVEVPERIGYLPENNPLYEEMYVSEYLMFMYSLTAGAERPLARSDLDRSAVRPAAPERLVDALIERVGLTPERHKHIRELSKGYRQRVGLAQALLGDPQLLILDEPTTGLDPNQLVEIRSLIKDVRNQNSDVRHQPTIILSTHIMQEVSAMCDRVVILDHGEIKADRLIDEITDLEQLFHETTRTLDT